MPAITLTGDLVICQPPPRRECRHDETEAFRDEIAERTDRDLVIFAEVEDGAIVIYVSGQVDLATCEQLRDTIEPHMGPGQMIVLDLAGVQFVDSSSLRVLEQARGSLTADGGSLMLRNPSTAAHRLLSVAKLEDLLVEQRDDLRE